MEPLFCWGRALLDFAYPPHCAVCEAEIAAAEMLCPPCLAEIGTGSRFVCGPDTAFEQIAVLGDFTGALQQAVYEVKFHNQPHLGRALGRQLGRCMAGELAPLDGLLPVPLHPARQRERGYNESLEIALGLAEALGLPVHASALQRCKNTRQQALFPALSAATISAVPSPRPGRRHRVFASGSWTMCGRRARRCKRVPGLSIAGDYGRWS